MFSCFIGGIYLFHLFISLSNPGPRGLSSMPCAHLRLGSAVRGWIGVLRVDVAAASSEINRKSVPRPNPDTHHQTQTQQEAKLSNKASKPLKGAGIRNTPQIDLTLAAWDCLCCEWKTLVDESRGV